MRYVKKSVFLHQGNTQYTNRHRSLSGGALQTSPPQQRFPFGDGQFPGSNQGMGGMYPNQQQQQQQQMFPGQQARNASSLLQRQLSIPGNSTIHTSQTFSHIIACRNCVTLNNVFFFCSHGFKMIILTLLSIHATRF